MPSRSRLSPKPASNLASAQCQLLAAHRTQRDRRLRHHHPRHMCPRHFRVLRAPPAPLFILHPHCGLLHGRGGGEHADAVRPLGGEAGVGVQARGGARPVLVARRAPLGRHLPAERVARRGPRLARHLAVRRAVPGGGLGRARHFGRGPRARRLLGRRVALARRLLGAAVGAGRALRALLRLVLRLARRDGRRALPALPRDGPRVGAAADRREQAAAARPLHRRLPPPQRPVRRPAHPRGPARRRRASATRRLRRSNSRRAPVADSLLYGIAAAALPRTGALSRRALLAADRRMVVGRARAAARCRRRSPVQRARTTWHSTPTAMAPPGGGRPRPQDLDGDVERWQQGPRLPASAAGSGSPWPGQRRRRWRRRRGAVRPSSRSACRVLHKGDRAAAAWLPRSRWPSAASTPSSPTFDEQGGSIRLSSPWPRSPAPCPTSPSPRGTGILSMLANKGAVGVSPGQAACASLHLLATSRRTCPRSPGATRTCASSSADSTSADLGLPTSRARRPLLHHHFLLGDLCIATTNSSRPPAAAARRRSSKAGARRAFYDSSSAGRAADGLAFGARPAIPRPPASRQRGPDGRSPRRRRRRPEKPVVRCRNAPRPKFLYGWREGALRATSRSAVGERLSYKPNRMPSYCDRILSYSAAGPTASLCSLVRLVRHAALVRPRARRRRLRAHRRRRPRPTGILSPVDLGPSHVAAATRGAVGAAGEPPSAAAAAAAVVERGALALRVGVRPLFGRQAPCSAVVATERAAGAASGDAAWWRDDHRAVTLPRGRARSRPARRAARDRAARAELYGEDDIVATATVTLLASAPPPPTPPPSPSADLIHDREVGSFRRPALARTSAVWGEAVTFYAGPSAPAPRRRPGGRAAFGGVSSPQRLAATNGRASAGRLDWLACCGGGRGRLLLVVVGLRRASRVR